MTKELIVIAGATATGKTGISIEAALRLGTGIISADSRQVFREMRIGTDAPNVSEIAKVTHYLVRHRSIHDEYNAGIYAVEALDCLSAIFMNSDKAVLVGGSGLYIDALCEGFDSLPDSEPDIRQYLEDSHLDHGLPWLQEQLALLDPAYYKQVDLANPRRLIRALEIILISGKPYSELRSQPSRKRDFTIRKFCLTLPRTLLHARISARVDRMIEQGLVDEVRELLPWRGRPSLKTVGYQELFEYFDGNCSLNEATENIKTATRRYARRQETWFRRDKSYIWIDSSEPQTALEKIIAACELTS